MDFERWLKQAWDDHAGDAAAVAARVGEATVAAADTDARRAALARLVNHVHGEHLGRWSEARAWLARLGAAMNEPGASRPLELYEAGLALAAGDDARRTAWAPSEVVRIGALAAAHLATRDARRAKQLLDEAQAQAEATALPDAEPAGRALAIAGNSIACNLEDLAERSAEQRELMLLAAQVARQWWGRAGTWLEVERAEYRLAMSWLKAGAPATARVHAERCLAIVREQQAPALESFFAWEALAAVERAAADVDAQAQAVRQMELSFAQLTEDDRGWCQSSLDRLR